MFYLPLSLQALQHHQLPQVFKQEIKTIDARLLPLQQGLRYSSYANASNLSAIILNFKVEVNEILIKTTLFYTGIIAGCNCADDPTPIDEITECCDVLFTINKSTAATSVKLIN